MPFSLPNLSESPLQLHCSLKLILLSTGFLRPRTFTKVLGVSEPGRLALAFGNVSLPDRILLTYGSWPESYPQRLVKSDIGLF